MVTLSHPNFEKNSLLGHSHWAGDLLCYVPNQDKDVWFEPKIGTLLCVEKVARS